MTVPYKQALCELNSWLYNQDGYINQHPRVHEKACYAKIRERAAALGARTRADSAKASGASGVATGASTSSSSASVASADILLTPCCKTCGNNPFDTPPSSPIASPTRAIEHGDSSDLPAMHLDDTAPLSPSPIQPRARTRRERAPDAPAPIILSPLTGAPATRSAVKNDASSSSSSSSSSAAAALVAVAAAATADADDSDADYEPLPPVSPTHKSEYKLRRPKYLSVADSSRACNFYAPVAVADAAAASYDDMEAAGAQTPSAGPQSQLNISESRLLQLVSFLPVEHRPRCPRCTGATTFWKLTTTYPASIVFQCSSGRCHDSKRKSVALPLDTTSKEDVLCFDHITLLPLPRAEVWFDGMIGQVWRYRDNERVGNPLTVRAATAIEVLMSESCSSGGAVPDILHHVRPSAASEGAYKKAIEPIYAAARRVAARISKAFVSKLIDIDPDSMVLVMVGDGVRAQLRHFVLARARSYLCPFLSLSCHIHRPALESQEKRDPVCLRAHDRRRARHCRLHRRQGEARVARMRCYQRRVQLYPPLLVVGVNGVVLARQGDRVVYAQQNCAASVCQRPSTSTCVNISGLHVCARYNCYGLCGAVRRNK